MPDQQDSQKGSVPSEPAPTPEVPGGGTNSSGEIDEYVFAFHPDSGELLKIERLEGSKRTELSEEESAELLGVDLSGESDFAAEVSDPRSFEAGYYQALADVEAEFGEGEEGQEHEVPPEVEAAYYQGIEDYQAALSEEQ